MDQTVQTDLRYKQSIIKHTACQNKPLGFILFIIIILHIKYGVSIYFLNLIFV